MSGHTHIGELDTCHIFLLDLVSENLAVLIHGQLSIESSFILTSLFVYFVSHVKHRVVGEPRLASKIEAKYKHLSTEETASVLHISGTHAVTN
jgi:hypothetical protein